MITEHLEIETKYIDFPVYCNNENCEYSEYIWYMKTVKLQKGINVVRLQCDKCGEYLDDVTYIIKH